jgi:hypothetical protein
MEDLVPDWQQQFVQRGLDGIVRVGDRQVVLDWGQRLMDLMNVRYVLTTRTLTAGPDGPAYPLAFADGGVRVYQNATALPRAYAARSLVLATPRTVQDAVFDARFDPWSAVVLEEEPPPPLSLGRGAEPIAPVEITSATANRVELAPDLREPALVVLAESYDPGWQVTVDGRPARLLRANGLFRGVSVPAGRHQVVFRYRPAPVILGALVSGVALLGAIVIALWARRGRSPAA